MICKEFIELLKLLREKGIEVGSGNFLWERENFDRIYPQFYIAECKLSIDSILVAPAPTISDILTVAFGERVWGMKMVDKGIMLKNGEVRDVEMPQLQIGRFTALMMWDTESNKPLHECPKLCAWLVGEVK